MTTEKKVKEGNFGTIEYSWKVIQCEICKKSYPSRIQFKGQSVNILDYETPSNNYMILES